MLLSPSDFFLDGRLGTVQGIAFVPGEFTLNTPLRAGHAWEQDCAGPDVYIEDGQLGLPITPEMLLSG